MKKTINLEDVFLMKNGWANTKGIAAYVGLCERTIYRYAQKKLIPFKKTHGEYRFHKESVAKALLKIKKKPNERKK